jgi:hypothetical protein
MVQIRCTLLHVLILMPFFLQIEVDTVTPQVFVTH